MRLVWDCGFWKEAAKKGAKKGAAKGGDAAVEADDDGYCGKCGAAAAGCSRCKKGRRKRARRRRQRCAAVRCKSSSSGRAMLGGKKTGAAAAAADATARLHESCTLQANLPEKKNQGAATTLLSNRSG